MSSVASDPFWSVTLRSLRELTRLAVAALVLAVGLGGASVAPAPAPSPAALGQAASARAAQPLPHPAPAVERLTDAAAPPKVRRTDAPAGISVVPAVRPHVPAHDPGRGVPARRGPPTA
ncbi:hypothetical protein [Micromonospora sp. CPCC 205561]|uniref:hypothetical protein n=1 Tax=Micromonospora sp. CPCC 205561 TaxID=3122407 RepID=UPI002FEEE6D8